MDAVEYVKQRKRMCDYYVNCGDCPARKYGMCASLSSIPEMVPIVEKWVKEHPVKTRQSEFLKQWPDAEIDGDGLLSIAPCQLNVKLCKNREVCAECRRDFWLKEIK